MATGRSEPSSSSDDEPDRDEPSLGSLSFAGLTDFMGQVASSDAASDELPSGTLVGDVRIVRFLGAGGMGRVYEAIQDSTQRTVAVKVIRAGIVSAATARRLAHEAQILGRLSHPGIARIYSAGVARIAGHDMPYFVMEFVDRPRSITAFAAARGLSSRARVELFRQVCRGVAHGHERGVVHRDLKPGNILVDAAGQPKVIDFGVARCTAADGQLTTMHTGTGELLGTAQYMAPEQLFGTADDIDPRADVYALGLVLYELLTGSLPYDVRDRPIYEVARVVREVEPRSLATVDRELRGDLTAIVATCLDKDRGRRYPSAAAVAADLDRHLRGEPIVARPPGFLESLIRLASRHKAAALGLAAVLTTLVVAAAGMSVLAVWAEGQRVLATAAADLAERQLYRANVRSLQSFIESENPQAARAILDETLAIAGDPVPLELRCLGAELDESLVVLEPTGDPVVEVAFEPDGTKLVATAARLDETHPTKEGTELLRRRAGFFRLVQDRRAVKYTVASGDVFQRYEGATSGGEEVAGLPDRVFDRTADGRQLELDEDGRLVLRLPGPMPSVISLDDPRGRLASVAFAPGAERAVALTADHRLDLWDAADGKHIGSLDALGSVTDFAFAPDGSRLISLRILKNSTALLCVFETGKGKRLATIEIPGSLTRGYLEMAFSHDGRRLATAAHSAEVVIWNANEGIHAATLRGHSAVVTAIAWSADGRLLASGDRSGRICIWNVESGELERQCFGHSRNVLTMAFSPSGSRLVSGGVDGSVRIWPTVASRPLATVPLAGEPLAVAFRPDGQKLAVAAAGGDLEIWNVAGADRVRHLPVGSGRPTEVSFSPDGRLVALAMNLPDGTGEVVVWDAASGAERARFQGLMEGAVACRLSDDGSLAVTTSRDDQVTVWSLEGPRQLWLERAAAFHSLAKLPALFCLGGDVVAYKKPVLLDARTGLERHELVRSQIWSQAVSPDGSLLAQGTATGRTYLYRSGASRSASSAASGDTPGHDLFRHLGFVLGHSESVVAVAFDRRSERMVTGSTDGTARVWDLASLKELAVLIGHEGVVTQVFFTPDGRRVVTGSVDGTARIWDATLGVELCQFPASAEQPTTTAVSPDGRILVTPSKDAKGSFLQLRGLTNAEITATRQADQAERSEQFGAVGTRE